MRSPSSILVLDAAILVSAVLGRSDGVTRASGRVGLVTTDRVVAEVRRRIELGLERPDLLDVFDDLLQDVTVVQEADLLHLLPDAEAALRKAVHSGNGSTRDAHVVSLAWLIDGDIWSTDRDFAGTGVASWSTPNLMDAFDRANGDPAA